MMARMQISLDPELQRRAQRRAAELGISFAEYVRGVVTRDLGVRRKDAMIGEAIAGARRKRRPGR